MNQFLAPAEIAEATVAAGIKKSNLTVVKQLLLSIMAGFFIALAANGSSAASYGVTPVGLGKALAGTIFATGLVLVVVAGGELFTGNCLIIMSVLERKAKWYQMLRNLVVVYIGNFIGSGILCVLVYYSSQLNMDSGKLGAATIKTAIGKCNLSFVEGLCMGILCNLIVCLAVWVATAAKDIAGKVLVIFFPIFMFVSAGFEHCVANMYYITAGLLAKQNSNYVEVAKIQYNLTDAQLSSLNIKNFLVGNMVPVTLGNIIGGAVLVGCMYWLIFLKKEKNSEK